MICLCPNIDYNNLFHSRYFEEKEGMEDKAVMLYHKVKQFLESCHKCDQFYLQEYFNSS